MTRTAFRRTASAIAVATGIAAGLASTASAGDGLTITVKNEISGGTASGSPQPLLDYPRVTVAAARPGAYYCWYPYQLADFRSVPPGESTTIYTEERNSLECHMWWVTGAIEKWQEIEFFVQESPGSQWSPLKWDGKNKSPSIYMERDDLFYDSGFSILDAPPAQTKLIAPLGTRLCLFYDPMPLKGIGDQLAVTFTGTIMMERDEECRTPRGAVAPPGGAATVAARRTITEHPPQKVTLRVGEERDLAIAGGGPVPKGARWAWAGCAHANYLKHPPRAVHPRSGARVRARVVGVSPGASSCRAVERSASGRALAVRTVTVKVTS